jgi:DNA polymerase I
MLEIPDCFETARYVDTEYIPDVPVCRPVCLVTYDTRSGQTTRLWYDQLGNEPPFSVGPESLFVAYSAHAELGFFLALGWQFPVRVLDLFYEFMLRTNGLPDWPPKRSRRLQDAMAFYGLPCMDAIEKKEKRELILRGGPWSAEEQQEILDYCESDVRCLQQLLPAMMASYD